MGQAMGQVRNKSSVCPPPRPVADLRLMPDLPDFRAEPSVSPEGDAKAAARYAAWAEANLDPITHLEPPDETYGWDQLAEVDHYLMAAHVIKKSEPISFWLAWHRAGGFAPLERDGRDRSTIFRKIWRFRTFYGIHPDDASFPWLSADFERVWRGTSPGRPRMDLQHRNDPEQQPELAATWRPIIGHRSDPRVVEPEDPIDLPLAGSPGPTNSELKTLDSDRSPGSDRSVAYSHLAREPVGAGRKVPDPAPAVGPPSVGPVREEPQRWQ